MSQKKLITIVEALKEEIAHRTAEALIKRKVGHYSELTVAELTRRNLFLIEIVIQYLRSGDIHEYRNNIKKITEMRRQQGFSSNDIGSLTAILVEKIKEVVEEELVGPQNEQLKTDYINRIRSLEALGRASISSVFLKKADDEL
jgi:hypothetical protein